MKNIGKTSLPEARRIYSNYTWVVQSTEQEWKSGKGQPFKCYVLL